jgi:tRNA(Ile)-lysidine synthase TilS/MesJ
MRKVSKEIAEAFMKNENKRMGNSIIHPVSEWMTKSERGVFLHDNKIAWWENNHPSENLSNNIHLCFSMCGWDTPTTRERLNTIFSYVFKSDSVYLKQIKGEQKLFINDRRMRINENLYYAIRCVNGDVFLDHPIKKTG